MIKLLPFIPLISLLINFSALKISKLTSFSHFSAIFLALLFIFQIFNLNDNFSLELLSLSFLKMPPGFTLTLYFSETHRLMLLALGIIWLCLIFYSKQYFELLDKEDHPYYFNFFLPLIVGLISGVVLSENLLTLLFFYQFIALAVWLSLGLFSGKEAANSVRNFGILIIILPIFFFLGTSSTYFTAGEIDFISGGIFYEQKISNLSLPLTFYLISLSLIALAPIYLLFRNLHLINLPVLLLNLMALAFVIIIGLLKVIYGIFGAEIFNELMWQNNLLLYLLIINLFLSAVLAIRSEDLKRILFYLFFNQFACLLMFFLFFSLNAKRMQIISASFLLGQTLIFLIFANINLYLKIAHSKDIKAIFTPLKLNILALIFIFLNFAGCITAIGFIEKFWLFSNAFKDESIINIVALAVNILLILILALKLIWPMLLHKKFNSDLKNLGRALEHNFGLTIPIIVIPALLFLLSFPFLTKYLITF